MGIILFLIYNGFFVFLPVLKHFDDKFGRVTAIIESQSGWRLNEGIKMSHPVSFGGLLIINSSFCRYITAKNAKKRFYSNKQQTKQKEQPERLGPDKNLSRKPVLIFFLFFSCFHFFGFAALFENLD
jgi:hypothetical protein